MNRLGLVSALPILALGVAAVWLDADLVTGPRGAPMMVTAPGAPELQRASFDGDCGPAPFFSRLPSASDQPGSASRIVSFTLRMGPNGVVVGMQDLTENGDDPSESVLVLFDADGRLVTAGDPRALQPGDCRVAPDASAPGPV